MSTRTPLVSAVIAVYNGAKTISHALDSIAYQTYKNIEIVCVDDGSSDNTHSLLVKWQTDHPEIKMTILQNTANAGLAASLNKGIDAAQGGYIARIDADDMWIPDKLTKQMSFFASNPDYGMVGSFYINKKTNTERKIPLPIKDEDIKRQMFRKNPFGHSCVIIRKSLLAEVGGYNGNLREDRDLWFRLLRKTKFHNLPEFLVIRDISESHFVSPKELRRNILTVHTYIKQYKKSPLSYIWLIEPILVYAYHGIKKYVSKT